MLIVRPKIKPVESALSVLTRAARDNAWSRVDLMLAAHGIQCPQPETLYRKPAIFSAACRCLGLDYSFLEGVFDSDSSPTGPRLRVSDNCWLPIDVFTDDGTALCPYCLKSTQTPYLRKDWNLRLLPTCVIHGIELLRNCPSCGSHLTWERPQLHICGCGHDFRDSVASTGNIENVRRVSEAIDAGEVDWLTKIAERFLALDGMRMGNGVTFCDERLLELALGDDDAFLDAVSQIVKQCEVRVHPRLAMLSFLTAGPRIRMFAQAVLERLNDLPISSTSSEKPSGYVSTEVAAAALGVTRSVIMRELGYRKLIDEVNVGLTKASYRFSVASLDRLLRKLWRPVSGINERARRQALTTKIPDLVARFSQTPAACAGYDLMCGLSGLRALGANSAIDEDFGVDTYSISIANAAKEFRIYPELLRSMVRNGYVSSSKDPTFPRRAMLKRSELNRFTEEFVFSAELARAHGGCQTTFVERIFHQGVRPIGGPGIDGLLTHLFRKSDLSDMDWIAVLASGSVPFEERMYLQLQVEANSIANDPVPITDVAAATGIAISEVSKMVRRGILERVETVSRGVHVSERTYQWLKVHLQNHELIDIRTVASNLGESATQFRARWVRTGIVDVLDLGIRQVMYTSDVQKIEDVKRRYMMAVEAIEVLNRGKFRLPNLEKQGKLSSFWMGKNLKLRLYERSVVLALHSEIEAHDR